MLRCALILTPIALPFLLMGAVAPEDVGILLILPVGVGWVIAMIGCNHSTRIRDEVVAGTRTESSTRRPNLIFVAVFTLGVTLASALSLPMSEGKGHMSGLLPWVFGFCSLVFAGFCVITHELTLNWRITHRKR